MTSSLGAQRIAGNPQATLGDSTCVDPELLQWQPSRFDKIAMTVLCREDARAPGSMHETRSDEGCVIRAISRKPSIFRNSAGLVAQAGDA